MARSSAASVPALWAERIGPEERDLIRPPITLIGTTQHGSHRTECGVRWGRVNHAPESLSARAVPLHVYRSSERQLGHARRGSSAYGFSNRHHPAASPAWPGSAHHASKPSHQNCRPLSQIRCLGTAPTRAIVRPRKARTCSEVGCPRNAPNPIGHWSCVACRWRAIPVTSLRQRVATVPVFQSRASQTADRPAAEDPRAATSLAVLHVTRNPTL